ncbi:MAG: alpha/beta fold hydrolase [Pyrinomonadaceae bacterium]
MRHQVNGITLNVSERGSNDSPSNNPALIFLHYFGGSSREWSAVIDQLGNDYRCVAPDLRGFGESDAPATYAVSDYADDVAALIDKLQLDRFILVGHSMGGKIALALAARRLRGLVSLILLAPSPPTPEPITDEERARLLAGFGKRSEAEATIRKITARPFAPALFEQAIEDNLRSSGAAWRAWLEDGSREDISGEMSKIETPALVAVGAEDKGITTSLLEREILGHISQARLTVIPEAGHLLPLEASVTIAQLIQEPPR